MLAYSSFLPYFLILIRKYILQDFSKLKFFRRYCQIVIAKNFLMSYNKTRGQQYGDTATLTTQRGYNSMYHLFICYVTKFPITL